MRFDVWLNDDAVSDLNEMYEYISRHDTSAKAEHVLVRIEEAFGSLSEFPQHGAFPKELLELGIREFFPARSADRGKASRAPQELPALSLFSAKENSVRIWLAPNEGL